MQTPVFDKTRNMCIISELNFHSPGLCFVHTAPAPSPRTLTTLFRMSSLTHRIRSSFVSLTQRFMQHPVRYSLAALVLVAVLAFFLFRSGATAPTGTNEKQPPVVEVASVAALSRDSTPLAILGEVRSVTQAELRTQKPGDVTAVYVKAGQFVQAGTILAEIENAAERASVLSAQGSLAAAEASLAKARAGARTEDRVSAAAQTESAVVGLSSAEQSARSAYSQAYSLAEDAVFAKTDDFFSNPYTVNPSFRVRSATLDERDALEAERVALGEVLATWKERANGQTIPSGELESALISAESNLARIKAYLNKISAFVAEQKTDADLSVAAKSAQEAAMLAARGSVDQARAAVTGARSGLASARSGAQVASLSESKIAVGERPEDIAAAEAGVTQARGGLASAVAQLEKSLIRTPIAGTVSTLNLVRGEFVQAQAVAAVVSNPGALEIEGFVSQNALERLFVGQRVLVGGTSEGTVTTLAPGLDPVTKKARLTVGVPKDASLVNGQYIELAFQNPDATSTSGTAATDKGFPIPITAIKVLPRELVVFSVRDDNTLEAHTIEEGPIVGASMLVQAGVTPDLRIVIDARGLSEGDTVDVTSE